MQLHDEMIENVRDQSYIQIGFDAPGPSYLFEKENVNIYSHDVLMEKLKKNSFQAIIINEKIDDPNIYQKKFCEENLHLSIPENHELANRTSILFKELDGSTFLLAKGVGIWNEIVKRKMPNAKFLLQDSVESLSEIIVSSTIFAFATNITLEKMSKNEHRVYVPFKDEKATQTFYLTVLKENSLLINKLLN